MKLATVLAAWICLSIIASLLFGAMCRVFAARYPEPCDRAVETQAKAHETLHESAAEQVLV